MTSQCTIFSCTNYKTGVDLKMKNKNKAKPDDRRDNVDRIQKNIDMTIHNIELAEEMINKTDDQKMKKELMDKNERRRQSLDGMKREIKDEAIAKKNEYKKF